MSSLTNQEYVGLQASLFAMFRPEYQCARCLSRYPKNPDMQATYQRTKACESVVDRRVASVGGELHFRTCPGNFWDATAAALLDLSHAYQKGILPYAGSLMDQPAKIIDVFGVIERFELNEQAEAHKKAMAKAKAPGKAARGGK